MSGIPVENMWIRFTRIRVLLHLIGFALLLGACVPNKKLVYLQNNDELKESVKRDTILRTYELQDYEYRVQPEDVLSIRFESLTEDQYDIFATEEGAFGNQNILGLAGYLVDTQGYIEFPEIGKVKVSELTVHEIATKLQGLAKAYVDEPTVKVRLLNFRVTVLGEVLSEGVINSFDNRLSIMEAIGRSGGLGELADRSRIKIIRQNDGQSKVLYVNLLEENLMNSDYFFLHQNDIIIVSPLKQRPFRRYFGPNIALLLSSASTLLLIINLLND